MEFFKRIEDTSQQIGETMKAVVQGPSRLSAEVRKVLAEYGDKPISKAVILRTPVSSPVKDALNVVSLGEFKKRLARQPYDDIFHLFMLFTVGGTAISLEKNAIITMKVNPNRSGESREVVVPPGLTLNQLMDATAKKMGKKFIPYASNSNNCQSLILNVLQANGMDTPELDTFVKQDTSELFDDYLRKFSNTITDLGARVATVTDGASIKPKNRWVQHVKDYQAKHNVSYTRALKEASNTYLSRDHVIRVDG